jgi:hypothetical protein
VIQAIMMRKGVFCLALLLAAASLVAASDKLKVTILVRGGPRSALISPSEGLHCTGVTQMCVGQRPLALDASPAGSPASLPS